MARAGMVVVLFIAVAVGLVAGCFSPGSNPSLVPPAVQRHVSLATPSGPSACADAEQLIEDQVVLSMRALMASQRHSSSGPGGGGGGTVDAGSPGGGGGSGSFSTTNLQTSSVDEADVMKNDGTRIFALSGTDLALLQSWPDTQLQVRGRLQLGQLQRELLLVSPERLVVFSGGPVTRATFVDVSNLSSPRITGEIDLPGSYLTARRVGTAIRVVLSGSLPLPLGVRLTAPVDDAEYAAQEQQNELQIRAQPLSYWLPDATTRNAAGQERRWPHPCDQVTASNAPVTLGMTTVATLDASNPGAVDRWSMLGEAGTVYASERALYLASPHWWWWSQPGQLSATYVHKFDISTATTAVHVASGVFDGTISDSFALDEHEGRLRVATTISELRSDGVAWKNRVVVLEPSGRELVEIGRTVDFGAGERIQSARFLGTRAFVVTFRRVDPLFTLDMSDPTAPRILGELTVPGFSTYLHPVGDAQLVGVGVAPGGGPQVSLFDVSDLTNPRQVDAIPLGFYGRSDALGDHRAFTWLPQQKLFAVPYDQWFWSGSSNVHGAELKVFQVGARLTELGALALTDAMPPDQYWQHYMGWGYRRAILTDQAAYAVTDFAVRVARLSDLDTPVATAITGSTAR